MKLARIIFNVAWAIFCFIISISQSYFSTLLFDEDGHFTILPLITNVMFWVLLIIFIIGNILISLQNKMNNVKEHHFEKAWVKQREKMITDVRKKAKRGDYSGAKETINIIHKLDNILKEKKK